MNQAQPNMDLLLAFFEPFIESKVQEKVNQKLAALKLRTEPERPIMVKDVAKMLGYSVSHIYTMCRKGELPYFRKGRWLYFYVSEINKWIRGAS